MKLSDMDHMAPADMDTAQRLLHGYLERVFGPKLRGVSGYGVGIDHGTLEPALNVMTTSDRAAQRARSSLPAEINGLSVVVSLRGPAIFG